jgi:hypothetical protein
MPLLPDGIAHETVGFFDIIQYGGAFAAAVAQARLPKKTNSQSK